MCYDFDCPNRISSELKEVVFQSNTIKLQDVAPDRSNLFCFSRFRRHELSPNFGAFRRRGRKRFAIQFPAWRVWKFVDRHDDIGHHVLWQRLRDIAANLSDVGLCVCFGQQVADQSLVALTILAQNGGRLADRRLFCHRRINFAQLDTMSIEFDLIVDPTQVFDLAVFVQSCKVTCAIDMDSIPVTKRLGGLFRTFQISKRHAIASDQ